MNDGRSVLMERGARVHQPDLVKHHHFQLGSNSECIELAVIKEPIADGSGIVLEESVIAATSAFTYDIQGEYMLGDGSAHFSGIAICVPPG